MPTIYLYLALALGSLTAGFYGGYRFELSAALAAQNQLATQQKDDAIALNKVDEQAAEDIRADEQRYDELESSLGDGREQLEASGERIQASIASGKEAPGQDAKDAPVYDSLLDQIRPIIAKEP